MHIEVDQSGKIEQMNKDTYIAFSNHEQFCVKVPKKVKQELSVGCRKNIKQFTQKMFSISLYYCLKDYLKKKQLIRIDTEYPGWEPFIKRELVRLFPPTIDKEIIQFGQVSKESKAHKLAIRSFREEEKPNRILSKEDFIKWLK